MKKSDHQLIQRVLDGDVGREEFDVFQQRLRDEPALVDLYGGYAFLHHLLEEESAADELRDPGPCPAAPRFRIPAWVAIAALLLLAVPLAILRPWRGGAPREAAAVAFSEDAVWTIEGAHRRVGNSVQIPAGGTLHLASGRAAAVLAPLLTAVIDGPADIRFDSGEEIFLHTGRASFSRRNDGPFTVRSRGLAARADGASFGLLVLPGRDEEVHVLTGRVEVTLPGDGKPRTLPAGSALAVPAATPPRELPADAAAFATRLGRFDVHVRQPFVPAAWATEHGSPSVTPGRISGSNYAVVRKLPALLPGGAAPVLLATLEVGRSPAGRFHTDGWAGLSFFRGGEEILFFGDSYGTRPSWSLDVKQRFPVVFPAEDLAGPAAVTLRYDSRSGEVSLHEGAKPLGPPICRGTIPPGSAFDSIRLGASAGAELDVAALEIRTGGGR